MVAPPRTRLNERGDFRGNMMERHGEQGPSGRIIDRRTDPNNRLTGAQLQKANTIAKRKVALRSNNAGMSNFRPEPIGGQARQDAIKGKLVRGRAASANKASAVPLPTLNTTPARERRAATPSVRPEKVTGRKAGPV